MKRKIRDTRDWYFLLLIPILGTIIFSLMPLGQTIIDSLHNASGEFVGLANFRILFKDGEFIKALSNTTYMGILGVILNIPLAFIVANIINNIIWGKDIFKTILLLPIVMSMVTVALLFKFIFAADDNSIANSLLAFLGMESSSWLNNPELSRIMVVLMNLWKNLGYNVILFLAGLQNVRRDLYEASAIDGANTFKQWIYITIPSMKNTFIFVYINMCINVFKRFTDVYAISAETGEPAGSLFTIMLYIYRKTFSTKFSKDLGAASAASLMLFGIILAVTVMNFLLTEGDLKSKSKKKERK